MIVYTSSASTYPLGPDRLATPETLRQLDERAIHLPASTERSRRRAIRRDRRRMRAVRPARPSARAASHRPRTARRSCRVRLRRHRPPRARRRRRRRDASRSPNSGCREVAIVEAVNHYASDLLPRIGAHHLAAARLRGAPSCRMARRARADGRGARRRARGFGRGHLRDVDRLAAPHRGRRRTRLRAAADRRAGKAAALESVSGRRLMLTSSYRRLGHAATPSGRWPTTPSELGGDARADHARRPPREPRR